MSTTQKRQKTLNAPHIANLNSAAELKSSIKWSSLIYVGCLFIALIVGSLSGSAQFLPITPISSTTLTPFSSTTCHIDDWTALKALYESTDGENWKRQDGGWNTIIAGYDAPPKGCNLGNLEGIGTNAFGRVRVISVPSNNLNGIIPEDLSMLHYLEVLRLGYNNLSGTIPNSLVNLNGLEYLNIPGNKLSGDIPNFQDLISWSIADNRFTCDEVNQFLDSNTANYFKTDYSPQRFTHEYEPFVADTNQVNSKTFSFDLTNYNPNGRAAQSGIGYNWVKNGNDDFLITKFGQTATLHFNDVQPEHAGIYTLYVYECGFTFKSDPIYVIYPGYDFEGQPVEYNQIMVEFDSPESTEFYEDQILDANAGMVKDYCNCNRELYLWQFPSTEAALLALTEINGKDKLESNGEEGIDGGFNNNLNRVGDGEVPSQLAYYLPAPNPGFYPSEVNVYILDTGVDETSCINDSYLFNEAPIEICYGVTPASGYNYLSQDGIIDINYQDDQGHGTFGYHAMSSGFTYANNINIIPLKIFNSDGEGNLFDLTCAIYHAVDNDADLVNISAGYQGQLSSILEKAINTAREQEVFICTSAGNAGINIDTLPQYPASFAGLYHYEYNDQGEVIDSTRYSNVISVASQKGIRQFADYTNFGPNSVTLSCLGEDLAGMALNCIDVVGSGTSFATFVVSRYLALEIAKDKNRTLEEIWNAFEASELSWDGTSNLNKKTITGKRVDLNLTKQQVLNTGKLINNSSFEAHVIQTSIEVATLKYKIPENGLIQTNLYDATGRYVRQLSNEHINRGNHQLRVSKKILESGIYFVHIEYESGKGLKEHNILKLPILK